MMARKTVCDGCHKESPDDAFGPPYDWYTVEKCQPFTMVSGDEPTRHFHSAKCMAEFYLKVAKVEAN